MKIVFALGNPGSEYDGTRHNVGFMAIDAFAAHQKVNFADKSKFYASIAEYSFEGDKILLVKPKTYYNEVGKSARSLIDFYKPSPAEDMLVIHDDLALPFGTIRVRKKGSDAGNNGIKSLNAHIGQDYARLRVGIYTTGQVTIDDAAYVLNRFNSNELKALEEAIIPKTNELIEDFLAKRFKETSYSL